MFISIDSLQRDVFIDLIDFANWFRHSFLWTAFTTKKYKKSFRLNRKIGFGILFFFCEDNSEIIFEVCRFSLVKIHRLAMRINGKFIDRQKDFYSHCLRRSRKWKRIVKYFQTSQIADLIKILTIISFRDLNRIKNSIYVCLFEARFEEENHTLESMYSSDLNVFRLILSSFS